MKIKKSMIEIFLRFVVGLNVYINLSCNSEGNFECQSRIDCASNGACIMSKCEYTKKKCNTFGVFEMVSEIVPKNEEQIENIHIAFDTVGAVHYCYFGYKNSRPISYYGRQVSYEEFEEEEIINGKEPVVCDGIAISENGTVFIMSKYIGKILIRKDNLWNSKELEGLDSNEAAAALKSDDTFFQLKNIDNSTFYIAISLGSKINSQPLYVAKIHESEIILQLNGWNGSSRSEIVGQSPEIIDWNNQPRMLVGQAVQENVLLTKMNLDIVASTKGVFPRASKDNKGNIYVLYMNGNHELILNTISENSFESFAKLGEAHPNMSRKGHIPWMLKTDQYGSIHILYEDLDQGKDSLIYQEVSNKGIPKVEEIVTTNLADNLTGNGLYDIHVDVCGNPILAIIEKQTINDDNTKAKTKIILKEKR